MKPVEQWLGLELRHLSALCAVAHEGSFGRAAVRLGYTQSAISQQIAALERVVDTTLVERRGGRQAAVLTPAGEVLVSHAEAITARLAAARADVVSVQQPGLTLSIGTYQSVGAHLLPPALQEFARRRPEVRVHLSESNTDEELLELVAAGELDVTFAVLPLGDAPLEYIELLRDPYVLLVSRHSKLAQADRALGPADLDNVNLIGFRECRSVIEAEARLRDAGFEPRIEFRSNDNSTLQALVAAGVGAAFVPKLVFDRRDDGIVARDLGDRIPPRVLVLAWHRDRREDAVLREFAAVVGRSASRLALYQP